MIDLDAQPADRCTARGAVVPRFWSPFSCLMCRATNSKRITQVRCILPPHKETAWNEHATSSSPEAASED